MNFHRKGARLPGGPAPFYLLLLVIVLTPLPFGSIYQWSWAGLGLIVALLLVYSSIVLVFNKAPLPPPLKGMWVPGGLYLLVVAWVAFQGLDTPWTSWAHPIWAQSSELLDQETRQTISLDPYKTWSECLKMLTFGGIFWLPALYGRERDRARAALWVMALAGTLYALYGLVAQFTEVGTHLWFHHMSTSGGVRSTFVNRNIYANYVGFGLIPALALLVDRLTQDTRSPCDRTARWKRFISGEDGQVLLLGACALIMIAALFMTTSRGGVAAAIVALACLLICFDQRKSQSSGRAVARVSFGILALVIAGYVIAGGDLGFRLATTSILENDGRLLGYQLILQAISDAPLTGYGAGNALDVFYTYNDGPKWTTFNYPHNLYLGLAVDLGLPATAVLITAVGVIGLTCLKGLRRRRRDQIFPALGVSILLLVAVHGLVDSPLILSANAATFSFLLGLAFAQSYPTRPATMSAHSRREPDQAAEGHREPAAMHGE